MQKLLQHTKYLQLGGMSIGFTLRFSVIKSKMYGCFLQLQRW